MKEGYDYFMKNPEDHDWFKGQWAIWPVRYDEKLTTNCSFHNEAIDAFEYLYGTKPRMSEDLEKTRKWWKKYE